VTKLNFKLSPGGRRGEGKTEVKDEWTKSRSPGIWEEGKDLKKGKCEREMEKKDKK
jgi:hypothetical protein